MYTQIMDLITSINFYQYADKTRMTKIIVVRSLIAAYNQETGNKKELVYNPFNDKYSLS